MNSFWNIGIFRNSLFRRIKTCWLFLFASKNWKTYWSSPYCDFQVHSARRRAQIASGTRPATALPREGSPEITRVSTLYNLFLSILLHSETALQICNIPVESRQASWACCTSSGGCRSWRAALRKSPESSSPSRWWRERSPENRNVWLLVVVTFFLFSPYYFSEKRVVVFIFVLKDRISRLPIFRINREK